MDKPAQTELNCKSRVGTSVGAGRGRRGKRPQRGQSPPGSGRTRSGRGSGSGATGRGGQQCQRLREPHGPQGGMERLCGRHVWRQRRPSSTIWFGFVFEGNAVLKEPHVFK